MKIKGLEEYLQDDTDLMKKITYQEYQEKRQRREILIIRLRKPMQNTVRS